MAKNLGREYATMSEDERRKFALEAEEGNRELPAELDFDNPRNEEHMGRHYATPSDEVADPEHRDGVSAELDTEQHERSEGKRSGHQSSGGRENTESPVDDL
jgi:hypothetical protein